MEKVVIKVTDRDSLNVFVGLSKLALQNLKPEKELEKAFNYILEEIYEKMLAKQGSDSTRFTLKLKKYEAIIFKEMLNLTKETPLLTDWGRMKVTETINHINKNLAFGPGKQVNGMKIYKH